MQDDEHNTARKTTGHSFILKRHKFSKNYSCSKGIRVRGLRKEFPQFRKDPVVAVDKVTKLGQVR